MLGRLNYAAFVIPMAWHFLNRIRNLMARLKHHKFIRITNEVHLDLELWLSFLGRTHKGISLNLVIKCQSDTLYVTDSCEYGLGGFSVTTSRVW